jgi:hypothetical protein
MAKVYDITPIELREGVKGEDFEAFWLNEYGPQGKVLGWTSHLLKADRGERVSKYAIIWEMPSVETRDRIVPANGSLTEEGKRLLGPNFDKMNQKLDTFITGWPNTAYIELGG